MLTPEKLLREKAIFASVVYDLFLMPVFNWVALKVGSLTRSTAIPHDIAALNFVAVGLSFLNVCANLAPLPPLYKALKTGTSVLVLTQFRAKVAKSKGSAIATACVAINQLSTDPDISLWADRAGY